MQAPLSGLPTVPFATDASPLASSSRNGTGSGSPAGGSSPIGTLQDAIGTSAAAGPSALRAEAAGSTDRSGPTAEQRCLDSLQQAAQQAVAGINAQVCSPKSA
jgi:hypothetical protein